jgi:hypothetical protein
MATSNQTKRKTARTSPPPEVPANKRKHRPVRDEGHERVTIWVRYLLAETGESQSALARATGIDKGSISRSMSGTSQRRREWAVSDIWAMADYFEIKPEKFLTEPPNLHD